MVLQDIWNAFTAISSEENKCCWKPLLIYELFHVFFLIATVTEKSFRSTSINCVISVEHPAAFDELLFLYMLHIELLNKHLFHAISLLLNFLSNIKAFGCEKWKFRQRFSLLFIRNGALNNFGSIKHPVKREKTTWWINKLTLCICSSSEKKFMIKYFYWKDFFFTQSLHRRRRMPHNITHHLPSQNRSQKTQLKSMWELCINLFLKFQHFYKESIRVLKKSLPAFEFPTVQKSFFQLIS